MRLEGGCYCGEVRYVAEGDPMMQAQCHCRECQYITGGFFSLDGVHLTDLGYILFANEYIKAINAAYDEDIPLASITQVFANNGAFPDSLGGQAIRHGFRLSDEASDAILQFWAQPTTGRPGRTRSIR